MNKNQKQKHKHEKISLSYNHEVRFYKQKGDRCHVTTKRLWPMWPKRWSKWIE